MCEFTLWLCQLTVYTSVTAAILLLVKHILKYRIPPLLHFALWGILLIRILFPVLPQSPISVYNYLPRDGQITEEIIFGESAGEVLSGQEGGTYIDMLLAEESAGTHAASIGIDVSVLEKQQQKNNSRKEQLHLIESVLMCVNLVYVSGAVVCMLYLGCSYFRMWHHALRESMPCDEPLILERYGQIVRHFRLREKCAPQIRYGKRSMLIGILHPIIVLDSSSDASDYPLVLVHELNHYRQKDNLILLLSNVLCCLMWFNPLIWISRNALRDDLEILCDSRTLQLPSVTAGRYAKLLYISADAAVPGTLAASYMSAEGTFLKHRLKSIAGRKKHSILTRLLSSVLCIASMAMCLTDPVQSLAGKYDVYMETGENLVGDAWEAEDPADSISGVRFYNMVYSILRNRTGGNASPIIEALGDGSLNSFIRTTAMQEEAFVGFGEFMMDVAAEKSITWGQAAVILDTVVRLSADQIYEYEEYAVPRQIRDETLERVLQNLTEQEAKALLGCYNRGNAEEDIRFASCYSVETIVRIMQCIENEWLRMKFISYYYVCPVEKLPLSGEFANITAQTKYAYVYRLQTDILEREERTLREILAITNSGLREDVFYLKGREDLYSYGDIASLFAKAGFSRRDMQEEYAAIGYNEFERTSGKVGWSIVDPNVEVPESIEDPHIHTAIKKMCAYGIMDSDETGEYPVDEKIPFGEVVHILCLLHAGIRS